MLESGNVNLLINRRIKMKRKERTFKKVAKEKSLEELNRFAKELTELYANSVMEYTQKNLASDNNLTVQGARDLMDYAIVMALVSRETASKVLRKATQNQRSKNQAAGGTSFTHHRKLIRQREEYLANAFSRVEVKKMAEDFARQTMKPISEFARKYEIESERVIRLILHRAIAENIVSDEVMEAMIRRSLKNNETQAARQYFENLREERKKENSALS